MSEGAVLITGASRGIGRAIADMLGARGQRVVNLSRTPPARACSREMHVAVDLADAEATAEALAGVTDAHDIAGLVNNAGISIPQTIEEVSLDVFESTLAVNVRAAVQCAQAVLPAMKRAGWGRIVNISSRAVLGNEGRTVYAASKAGLDGMTRVWALELARFAITVNSIAPGPVDTELFRSQRPLGSPEYEARRASVPLGRLGTPEDIARAVLFFLEPDNGFVTGQLLFVCGGLSIPRAPG